MRTMANALAAAVTLAALLLNSGTRLQAVSQKQVKISMPYLESFQTTEHGEDEVYLLVSGKWGNGQTFSYRFPDAAGHWDLNDGDGDPPVRNQNLLNVGMFDGQVLDLVILMMEEDGGTSKPWVDIASTVASVVLPEASSVLGVITSFLNFEDSDDFIGSFSMHIEQRNGQTLTSFRPMDRVYGSSDPSKYWISFAVNMNGDGSNYQSQFAVTD
jgi:hypothetical protein